MFVEQSPDHPMQRTLDRILLSLRHLQAAALVTELTGVCAVSFRIAIGPAILARLATRPPRWLSPKNR